jgi:hypothetical protein
MSQDYLRECMSDPALVQGPTPIDEFSKAFCIRCIQKDCTRARLNGSLFARRVETWKTNLFDSPPRAKDDDPRYQSIRAKRFLQTANEVVELRQGGVNYEVQTREMPEIPAALRREPVVAAPEPVPSPAPVPEPVVQTQTAPVDLAPPPPPPPPPPAPVRDASFQNTPFEQGTVLPGGQPQEKVTEVGGSFTFGSDE